MNMNTKQICNFILEGILNDVTLGHDARKS